MSNTPSYTSLFPHHKSPIGGRSLSCFLLVLFFLVPQDALAIGIGDRVVVQNTGSLGLNVRTGPSTDYSVIGKVYDGAKGTITSGPRNANGYTWWKVRWESYHGWSVDYYDGDRLIAPDEPALKPSISSVGDASATEGNTLSFTVRLTASTSQTETYYYSTYYGGDATAERGDYDGAAEESIRVRSGQSSFTVDINTHEDADFDDETVYLYVTGEANHPSTTPGSSKYRGTGTIRDDDEPALKPSISSVGDASATEGNTLRFTVRLTASTSQTETYYYSTFYGGDATAERGDYDGAAEESISVGSGESSFTVGISTNEDADFDDETVYLYVTGESNHPSTTPGSSKYRGTGTIRDDDEPALKPSISSVGDASATEGNTLSFTVTLSASTSQTETYYYSTFYGGDATAERGDYDGAAEESISVGSGESSFTVGISTNEDADFDDETLFLYVTGEANHPSTTPGSSKYRGTGTIRDDDEPALKPSISSVGDASATEGNTLRFTVRLSASTSQTETYYYSTFYGGDATAERGDYDGAAEESISVGSGQGSFTVGISTNEDADYDDETLFLYVTEESNHPSTTRGSSKYRGTGTIRDDDEPALKSSISSVGNASATEGNTLSFTVTLSASTSQTETYYYSTFYGGDATAERGDYDGAAEESISVGSGQGSFTVGISTNEDADYDDETVYLYVTGEANHPSTTPDSSKYRGTGTIQDDDSPTTTGLTRLYWEIARGNTKITGGPELTIGAGQAAEMVAVFSSRPSGTFTFKIYEADVSGGQLVKDNSVSPVSHSVSAVNAVQDGSTYTLSVSWTSVFSAGTETASPAQAEYYFTVEKDGAVLRSMLDDANGLTGILNKVGPLLSVESSTAPSTPTPPTSSAPSGTHRYTFSLDNKSYTVTSGECYSRDSNRGAIERYVSGLRIYNDRNELVRPTYDVLFQLTAAHASACVLAGIDFETFLDQIAVAIGDVRMFDAKFREAAGLEGRSDISSLSSVPLMDAAIKVGWDLGKRSAGVATSAATGLAIVKTVFEFYARKVLGDKEEEIANLISDVFFAASVRELAWAKSGIQTLERVDLARTIDITDLRKKMLLLDHIKINITYFNNLVPAGQNYARRLYPALTLSGFDKFTEVVNRFFYEEFSPIALLLDSISFELIMDELTTTLNSNLHISLIKNSPFDVLNDSFNRSIIDDHALTGTSDADVMYNYAPGAQLYGRNGNDWMYGENVSTVMFGGDGDDHLFGGSRDDVLTGGKGNDELKGGGGQDVARFEETRSNYDIRWDSAMEWLTVSSSADGSDRVYRDIEFLRFLDGIVRIQNIEGPTRNLPPALVGNIENQIAIAGERFNFYIPFNLFVDPDEDRLTWSVSGLPNWLAFDLNTLLLSGTPASSDAGRWTITVSVAGSPDSETFTLSVINPNAPPVLTVPSAPYVVADGGWTRLSGLSVTDADNDDLTMVAAVKYGELKATGTMVVDVDMSADTLFSDMVGFRPNPGSSIATVLATLEYKPPRNWEAGQDLLFLLVSDGKVQKPVYDFALIYPDREPVLSGTVSDQTYTVGAAISELTLPSATGGTGTLTYHLTPAVPGLSFTPGTRTLTGTPTTAGTYPMTYTVTDASSNTDTDEFTITVEAAGAAPDLVVESPSVGSGTLDIGQSFIFRAIVRNQGTGSSDRTTLRYYRSSDTSITTGDTEVGTDRVSSLSAGGTSRKSKTLTAPSGAGTYYYGACVEAVSGESNRGNNCSSSVTVTVTASPPSGVPVVTLALSPPSITEKGGISTVTATLSRALSAATTVTVSAAPVAPAVAADFALSTNKTLTIAAGTTTSTGTVTITANDNAVDAPDKTVTVSATATSNVTGPANKTLTITDDEAPPPAGLVKISGDEQEGPAGAQLAEPFVVEVRDQNGSAFAGAVVTFVVTAGGGTLSSTTATTDANGRARSTLTLGSDPGTNTVAATVEGLEYVTFTAIGQATTDPDGDGELDDGELDDGELADDEPSGEDQQKSEEKPTTTVELEGISSSHDSVRENDGQATTITVTVTLDKAAATDETITLAIVSPTEGKTAKRDEDFDATLDETLTIAKGQRTGTAQLSLTPKDNTTADGDKAFAVEATSSSGHQALINIKIDDDEMDDGEEDDGEEDDGEEDDGEEDDRELAFGFAGEVEDQAYTAGTTISALELPEAVGGEGEITYRVSDLPAGLTFDDSTRTLSGTPDAATDGAVEITYTAQDSTGASATLTFSITVNPALSFGAGGG